MQSTAAVHDDASACPARRGPSQVLLTHLLMHLAAVGRVAWEAAIVRRLGAHLNLLRTPIQGRRARQRRPPQLSLMHQDIRWMFLMHETCLFPAPRLPVRRRHLPSTATRRGDVAGYMGHVDCLGGVRGTYSDSRSCIRDVGSAQ